LKAPELKKNRLHWSGKFEYFSKLTRKEDQWTILCVGGKNRAADSNFGEKMALQFSSFKTALTSSVESCNKRLLNTTK